MSKQHRVSTWFVYVESKTQPGKFQYYGEYNGLGHNAENDAQLTAADLAEKGSRAFITNEYVGSGFFSRFFDEVKI